ncbi:MAG: hypothetical protein AAB462_03070 [Patescibacteria group bacterium]
MGILSNGGFDGRAERVRAFNQEFDRQRNPRPCPEGVDPKAWQKAERTRLNEDELVSVAGELSGMILERTATKGVLAQSGIQAAESVVRRVEGIVRKDEAGMTDAANHVD